MKKENSIFFFGAIYFIISLTSIGSVEASRDAARDGRAIADMNQIRSEATIIELEEESYLNVSCTGDESIKALCDDIENMEGMKPTIHSTKEAYCAYTTLLFEQDRYHCIDSDLNSITTYIPPGGEGYCDGKTFVCPTEEGSKKFSWAEFLPWIKLIGGGIVVLFFYSFLWKQALKRRREEIDKEESWLLIEEELKARDYFYILLILLFSSIIFPLLFIFFCALCDYYPSFKLLIFSSAMIGGIAAIALIVSTPRLIKEAWKDKTKIVCWEAYAACFCFSASILSVFFPVISVDVNGVVPLGHSGVPS